jgi:hypothetical protein
MSSPFSLPEIVGFVIDKVHMVPDLPYDLYLAVILPIEHLGKWAYSRLSIGERIYILNRKNVIHKQV